MALPIGEIVTGLLGILNFFKGSQAEAAQAKYLNLLSQITGLQFDELKRLMAILRDPNNPERMVLLDRAVRGVESQVASGSQNVLARLAAAGLRSPQTIAGPLSSIARAGVAARGEVERGSLVDFLTKRLGLVNPALAQQGATSLADIYGEQAGQSGEALGGLLNLFLRLRYPKTFNPNLYPSPDVGGGSAWTWPETWNPESDYTP